MKTIPLVILTLYLSTCFSQDGNFGKGHFILSPGLSYQGQLFGELNVMYCKHALGGGVFAMKGFKMGVESNFSPDRFIYAPKISWEYSILNFCLKAGSIGYVDNKKVEIRLLPEFSFTSFVLLTLTYGYGIPISDFATDKVSRHRVALVFNLDRKMWKEVNGK